MNHPATQQQRSLFVIPGGNVRLLLLLSIVAGLCASQAWSQARSITIHAVDGRTGKPLAAQRLIVFGGTSEDKLHFHESAFESMTDVQGFASLSIGQNIKFIQVWTDGLTLCQAKPNLNSFAVDAIESGGLATTNNCGSLILAPTAGVFTVFARASTLREKMER